MRTEHLKGWLAEARKKEAAAAKPVATEGMEAVLGGTGGKEREEKRDKTDAETTN